MFKIGVCNCGYISLLYLRHNVTNINLKQILTVKNIYSSFCFGKPGFFYKKNHVWSCFLKNFSSKNICLLKKWTLWPLSRTIKCKSLIYYCLHLVNHGLNFVDLRRHTLHLSEPPPELFTSSTSEKRNNRLDILRSNSPKKLPIPEGIPSEVIQQFERMDQKVWYLQFFFLIWKF